MVAVRPGLLVVVGFLMMSFAGCAGNPDPAGVSPSTPAPPPATDVARGGGTIDGTVVDDEVVPIAQARVLVYDLNAAAAPQLVGALPAGEEAVRAEVRTDDSGGFVVKGLPEGKYGVYASKAGYRDPPPKTVDVVADSATTVQIVLEPLPVVAPYHLTKPLTTRLDNFELRGPDGGTIMNAGLTGALNPNNDPDECCIDYENNETDLVRLQTIVMEMTWTAGFSPCKWGVEGSVQAPSYKSSGDVSKNPNYWQNQDVTTSPTRLVIPREGSDPLAMHGAERVALNGGTPIVTEGIWEIRVTDAFVGTLGTPVDFSCVAGQRVDSWTTFFHVEAATADWSALPK